MADKSIKYLTYFQQNDGSWHYGESKTAQSVGIDNFHTGFILESLKMYTDAIKNSDVEKSIAKGLSFYQNNFFLEDGAPKYFYNKVYPLDIHSAAQSIITLVKLKKFGADQDLCDRIVNWVINNLKDKLRVDIQKRLIDRRQYRDSQGRIQRMNTRRGPVEIFLSHLKPIISQVYI